jgi:hypothetical protein
VRRTTNVAVLPEDIRATALTCHGALLPFADADWELPAGELEWSCRTTLAHVLAALLYYAINLATRSTELRFSGQADPSLPIPELLDALKGRADVLAVVCAAAPPGARGAHDWGVPDASGFAALACDEMLLHTSDIALGLTASFDPPREVCARVLARLFPWAPEGETPGRFFAGRTGVWHWRPGGASLRPGCPILRRSTNGTARPERVPVAEQPTGQRTCARRSAVAGCPTAPFHQFGVSRLGFGAPAIGGCGFVKGAPDSNPEPTDNRVWSEGAGQSAS